MKKSYVPEIHHTVNGTAYLRECGVALVASPRFHPTEATQFVNSFGSTFDAADYENDWYVDGPGTMEERVRAGVSELKLDDGTALAKFAGQVCYLSFGEKRTRNDDAKRYFDNIKASGHGSVLEHANYSFVAWGVDRSCSHELVRHRAGFGFSQVSQRYVSGATLRFVERPEYQDDAQLHETFVKWIDCARQEYDHRAELLARVMKAKLADLSATDRRKAVNQAARACLPNETETAMVITANVRALRNVVEQRANVHADRPIRQLAYRMLAIIGEEAPLLFDDYVENADGSISTTHRKV